MFAIHLTTSRVYFYLVTHHSSNICSPVHEAKTFDFPGWKIPQILHTASTLRVPRRLCGCSRGDFCPPSGQHPAPLRRRSSCLTDDPIRLLSLPPTNTEPDQTDQFLIMEGLVALTSCPGHFQTTTSGARTGPPLCPRGWVVIAEY